MTQETINEVLKFRDDRDWKPFHNPKDLAISISLEAAELLEVFQWSAEDVTCEKKIDKIKEELADVVNYCILMVDTCGLDLDEQDETAMWQIPFCVPLIRLRRMEMKKPSVMPSKNAVFPVKNCLSRQRYGSATVVMIRQRNLCGNLCGSLDFFIHQW